MGGAEWMGASVDQKSSIMYVTANNIPYEVYLKNKEKLSYYEYDSHFEVFKDQNGFGIKTSMGHFNCFKFE